MNKRVLVALGGGAQSAVAAALLKSEGYQVEGVFFDYTAEGSQTVSHRCQRPDAVAVVSTVAKVLGIPMRAESLAGEYDERVLDRIVHDVMENRAPQGCLECIGSLRLEALARVADRLGIEKIAMGLSARIMTDVRGQVSVHQALESGRDQSDLLSRCRKEILSRLLLPAGNLSGRSIQDLAREFGFPPFPAEISRAVSCYMNDGSYEQLIDARVPTALRPKGMIRTTDSKVAGQHSGLHHHQLGARASTELSPDGTQNYVVVGYETSSQSLIVGAAGSLKRREIVVSHLNWLLGEDGIRGVRCNVRVGVGGPMVPGQLVPFENGTAHVIFDSPHQLPSPGQAVSFYQGERLLGGATVERPAVGEKEKK